MPLYLVIAPDNPQVTKLREQYLPEHKDLSLASRHAGNTILGRAIMSEQYTHTSEQNPESPMLAPGRVHPGFAGSVMIYRWDNIDQAWARLKRDPFWLNDIWDHDKATIHELNPEDADGTVQFK